MYGILKFSSPERVSTFGVIFCVYPWDEEVRVVSTKVRSHVDRWAKVSPELGLLELYGPVGHYETEAKILKLHYGILPCRYPDVFLLRQPEDIAATAVFTVDDPSTLDRDDAISVQVSDLCITVGVHITDVSKGIRAKARNYEELLAFAELRCSSAYGTNDAVCMFPTVLNEVLSIDPGCTRPSITLWMQYDAAYNLLNCYFEDTLVRSEAALTYDNFSSERDGDFKVLSNISKTQDSRDVIAFFMKKYNETFVARISGIAYRTTRGYTHEKEVHSDLGVIYTHATSPMRRFVDLVNQDIYHGLIGPQMSDALNDTYANIRDYHRRRSVLDLCQHCKNEPLSLTCDIQGDTALITVKGTRYKIYRNDTYYEFPTDPRVKLWGILKNGTSTLRIQTESEIQAEPELCPVIEPELQSPSRVRLECSDIEDKTGYPLDTFQISCLDVINEGNDLFGAAPTGSGKTTIAMMAILRAFAEGRRAIYTSPIKSLSNEKFQSFSVALQSRVTLLTGDIRRRCAPPGGDGAGELLIMTAEILRNKLLVSDDPDLRDVSVVIVDEVHYIIDAERGPVWEETFMMLPSPVSVVALSATLSNPERFCDWLSKRTDRGTDLVLRNDRHVPLYFGSLSDKFVAFADTKGLVPSTQEYSWNKPDKSQKTFQPFVKKLVKADLCPAIIFCMSRRRCVEYAHGITDNIMLSPRPVLEKGLEPEYEAQMQDYSAETLSRTRAFQTCVNKYLGRYRVQLESIPGYSRFLDLLYRGVAYHHSAMVPILREFVEVLFRAKMISVVFATETLGCGIDMPARTVVFTQLDKPSGSDGAKRYLRHEEFMQMAGRAGRRGKDIAGYVIYYSLVGTRIEWSTFNGIYSSSPPQATSQLKINAEYVLRNCLKIGDSLQQRSLLYRDISDETQDLRDKLNALGCPIGSDEIREIHKISERLTGRDYIKYTAKQAKKAKARMKELLGSVELSLVLEARALGVRLEATETYIKGLWDNSMRQLVEGSYMDTIGNLSILGRVAAQMCDGHPLARAKALLYAPAIHGATFADIAAWLALYLETPFEITETDHGPDHRSLEPRSRALEELTEAAAQDLDQCNVEASRLVYDYVLYKDISMITRYTHLCNLGSFVKLILRVSSFMDEIKTALLGLERYELYNVLENHTEKLYSGIVTAESIYV